MDGWREAGKERVEANRKGQRKREEGVGQEMTGQRQKDAEGRHSSGCLCVSAGIL